MDIEAIITTVVTALCSGGLGSIIGWRAKKRQETAEAAKKETEVKADQIENIRKTMDDVYKPIIDDLKRQVNELREEVREVREENERLKDENDQLRDAIREIQPDLVPSRRSINASNQPRLKNGQFTKKS